MHEQQQQQRRRTYDDGNNNGVFGRLSKVLKGFTGILTRGGGGAGAPRDTTRDTDGKEQQHQKQRDARCKSGEPCHRQEKEGPFDPVVSPFWWVQIHRDRRGEEEGEGEDDRNSRPIDSGDDADSINAAKKAAIIAKIRKHANAAYHGTKQECVGFAPPTTEQKSTRNETTDSEAIRKTLRTLKPVEHRWSTGPAPRLA